MTVTWSAASGPSTPTSRTEPATPPLRRPGRQCHDRHRAVVRTESPEPRPTLSVAEAADLLGVSSWLVLPQIAAGSDLPHKRVGRRILPPRHPFFSWLEDQRPSPDDDNPPGPKGP